jgi:hypothetical protein
MRLALRIVLAWLSLSLAALGVGAIEAIAAPGPVPMPGQTWGGLIGLYMIAALIAVGGVISAAFWLFFREPRP